MSTAESLVVDEELLGDGSRRVTRIERAEGGFVLAVGSATWAIGADAVVAVVRRYGLELDPAVEVPAVGFDLGQGATLHRLTHRAWGDVLPTDYVVLRTPEHPPIAAMTAAIGAPLRFLAERFDASRTDA